MALIELDDGRYINTDEIYELQKGKTKWHLDRGPGGTFPITDDDKQRIVEAMQSKQTIKLPKPYAWETKEGEILYTVEDKFDYEKRYHSSAWALWDFDTLAAAGIKVEVSE